MTTYSEHSLVERSERRRVTSLPVEGWHSWGRLLRRLAWSSPLLAVVVATGLLASFGASLHDAFVAALVLVWFVLVLWGALLGAAIAMTRTPATRAQAELASISSFQ